MAKRRTTTCARIAPEQRVEVCVRRPSGPGPQIKGPGDVCALLRGAEDRDRESFYGVYLDSTGRVIGVEEIARGGTTSVPIDPRTVFRGAIVSGAANLIVAHNHPSGQAVPSEDDKLLTKTLAEAGKIVGMPILDHVIVAREGCYSFATSGRFSGIPQASTPTAPEPKAKRRRGC